MVDATATSTATTVADERGVVNGPEGELLEGYRKLFSVSLLTGVSVPQ
jgi:hypothetical protein